MQIKLKPKRFFYVVLLQPTIAPLHSYIYGNIAKLWKNIQKNVFEKKVFDKLRFILRQLHSGFEEVTHWRAATNSSSSVFLHLTDLAHAISSPRDYMVTFEPMPLIHIPLNVQMHCHIICGKHQILSSFCHWYLNVHIYCRLVAKPKSHER